MSRCRTGWRIYRDSTVAEWAGVWVATHERGLTHYRSTWAAAFIATTRETLREWELIDGVWHERKAVVLEGTRR